MTISLAFLSPVLVKAALEGRLPRGIGATRLCDARRVVAATPDARPEPLNAALRSNLSHQTASLFPRKKDSGPENPGAGNCTGCWRGDPETTRPRAAPQNAGRLQFSGKSPVRWDGWWRREDTNYMRGTKSFRTSLNFPGKTFFSPETGGSNTLFRCSGDRD